MPDRSAPSDDTIRFGANAAPIGADVSSPAEPSSPRGPPHNALPAGTSLHEFEIREVIGEGGFGIVYRAYDHVLEREVALKEFLPAALAQRRATLQVSVISSSDAETFSAALGSFVKEARLLAQFDHSSLLKVHRFWEANGTAYMVMPLYRGETLKSMLVRKALPVTEAWLARLLSDLLDALEVLHANQCVHRDVAPDNIMILDGGRPILLDFGAARQVISESTKALTVIYKPAYAPIEQHTDSGPMKQGPWTDLYALAGVAHYAITGSPPPSAIARLVKDNYQPLARVAAGRFGARLLTGLDRGLAVRPTDRPQSVAEMRQVLGLESPARVAVPAPTIRPSAKPETPEATAPKAAAPLRSRSSLFIGVGAGFAALLALGGWLWLRPPLPAVAVKPPASPTVDVNPASQPSSPAPIGGPAPYPKAAVRANEGNASDEAPRSANPGPVTRPATSAPEPRAATPVREPPASTPELERRAAKPVREPPASTAVPEPPAAAAVPGPRPAPPATRPSSEPSARQDADGGRRPPNAQPAPDAAARERRSTQDRTSSPRCTDLLHRAGLGEQLSPADMAYLTKECR